MRTVSHCENGQHRYPTELFDLKSDPQQVHPISDPAIELRMCRLMRQCMEENDAAAEQYERMML